jgi:hypothetical protein
VITDRIAPYKYTPMWRKATGFGASHSARCTPSRHGAICARSLTSKLADSLRLIIKNRLTDY